MSNFRQVFDKTGKILYIETNVSGQRLLTTPKLNKGSAFNQKEREQFGLLGKLPYGIETLDQQAARTYQQFLKKQDAVQKHDYLRSLHDTNETLFYKVIGQHLEEMLPIIYTPTIGKIVEQSRHAFRRARGLYIAYPDRDRIDEIIENRVNKEVDIVIITDGEGVLGIGDQGIAGMDICIAKLMVYVLCGGLNPYRLLPIQIDVGTNNEKLLNDPMYLGLRHKRLVGKDYDDIIERTVTTIQRKLPHVYLHWEDFGRENSRRNLQRYQSRCCTFNDDMQGTGVVTLAALLTAIKYTKQALTEQRIVIFGAGTAGAGIADQLCAGMVRAGMNKKDALARFWLLDKNGLLMQHSTDLTEFQRPYARYSSIAMNLEAIVKEIKPTVLIGCSSQAGAFSEAIIKTMASAVHRPIIFPLSNPTEKAEATPFDLLYWTEGRALIATGSPFSSVDFQGTTFRISQCNNALIYPGIGLGVVVAKATRLSDAMLWVACKALSSCTLDTGNVDVALLPNFSQIQYISQCIALAVAEQARKENLALVSDKVDFKEAIENQFWVPKYHDYRYSTDF